jgi:hypothetical protein
VFDLRNKLVAFSASTSPLKMAVSGTHFTCFTGTKVQILAFSASTSPLKMAVSGMHFTCFTSTKVQSLTLRAAAQTFFSTANPTSATLLALLVQKYNY